MKCVGCFFETRKRTCSELLDERVASALTDLSFLCCISACAKCIKLAPPLGGLNFISFAASSCCGSLTIGWDTQIVSNLSRGVIPRISKPYLRHSFRACSPHMSPPSPCAPGGPRRPVHAVMLETVSHAASTAKHLGQNDEFFQAIFNVIVPQRCRK